MTRACMGAPMVAVLASRGPCRACVSLPAGDDGGAQIGAVLSVGSLLAQGAHMAGGIWDGLMLTLSAEACKPPASALRTANAVLAERTRPRPTRAAALEGRVARAPGLVPVPVPVPVPVRVPVSRSEERVPPPSSRSCRRLPLTMRISLASLGVPLLPLLVFPPTVNGREARTAAGLLRHADCCAGELACELAVLLRVARIARETGWRTPSWGLAISQALRHERRDSSRSPTARPRGRKERAGLRGSKGRPDGTDEQRLN